MLNVKVLPMSEFCINLPETSAILEYVVKPLVYAVAVVLVAFLSALALSVYRQHLVKSLAKKIYSSKESLIANLQKDPALLSDIDSGGLLTTALSLLPKWASSNEYLHHTYYLLRHLKSYESLKTQSQAPTASDDRSELAQRLVHTSCNVYAKVLFLVDRKQYKCIFPEDSTKGNISIAKDYFTKSNQ
jgi:hypothetical protein